MPATKVCVKCKKRKLIKQYEPAIHAFVTGAPLEADGTTRNCRRCRKQRMRLLKAHYRRQRAKNPDWRKKARLSMAQKRAQIRQIVLDHYGPVCVCCGETRFEFLTVDHVKGGGTKHRGNTGTYAVYVDIVASNFPPDYRILCYNCNCARGRFGYCPHEYERTPPGQDMSEMRTLSGCEVSMHAG